MPPTRMQSACRVRLHAHASGTGATEGMAAGCTPPDVGVAAAGRARRQPPLAAEGGVAVALDLGVGDEEAGDMAVGEANGGELATEDVLLDGGRAEANPLGRWRGGEEPYLGRL